MKSFLGLPVRVGLVWQFAVVFSVMTLLTGAILSVAVRKYADGSIRASSLALMGQARAAVFSKVNADLAFAESMVLRNAALARHGNVPLDDEQRLGRLFLAQVSREATIHYLFYANEQGGIASGGTQFGEFRLIYTPGMKMGLRIVERVDSSGALLARRPPPLLQDFDPRTRDWYIQTKKERRLVWYGPSFGTVDFPLSLVLAYPLVGPSGEFLGEFGGNVMLDSLSGYLEAHRSSPHAYLMLVEPDGMLVANSSRSPLFSVKNGQVRRLNAATVAQPLAREAAGLVGKMHASRAKSFDTLLHDGQGRAYYLDIAPYVHGQDIHWYLVTVVPRSDFTGPLDALWSRFMLILLGGAVGAVGLSLVMAGWVTRPMRAINERVQEIAAGRFGSRVESRRRDEIGQLVQAFNGMSERLAGTYAEIRRKHAELDAANRDLAALLESERVRRMEAEAEGKRAQALGGAIAAMSESQDYDSVLKALPRALVRDFVDWAVVEAAAPGGAMRTAGAHRNSGLEPLLEELIGKHAGNIAGIGAGASVLETGEPLLLPGISDEQIRSWCADGNLAGGIRRLGARTAIIVPLIARQKRIGLLALVSASPERFGPADLRFAADLGARAALAFDGALLYADLQRENAERKQAEAERRKTEDLLHGIVEKIPALIFVKDLDGRFLLVNRHMADVIGADVASVLGKTVFDVYPPGQARALAAFDQRVIAAGAALEGEEETPGPDGPRAYIQIEAPLTDAGGRVYALCGISTEITARKRAEAALRQSEERLRQAQKMEAIGNLAGGIAHDFNNLLSVILGYSSLLLPGLEPTDPCRAGLEQIDRAGQRARRSHSNCWPSAGNSSCSPSSSGWTPSSRASNPCCAG